MRSIKKMIEEFEEAAVERSWLGSRPPEEHAVILKNYELSKNMLIQRVDALDKKAKAKSTRSLPK